MKIQSNFSGQYILEMLLCFIFFVPILAFVDSTSIFSYFYALIIITIINILISNNDNKFTLLCYHYYLLYGIIIYVLNKYQLPEFIGTTGPMGIGTDDYTFYGQIVDGNVPYQLEVPAEYKYPFSIFIKALYPFKISTPLNLVLLNIVFVSYLPYYTGKLSYYLFGDVKLARYSKLLILLCPMTTMYGVIIIRDLLVTTVVVASLYYFLKKQYLPVLICLLLVAFVRFGSVSFMFAGYIIVSLFRISKTKFGKIGVIGVIATTIILFIVLLPTLQEFSGGKLSANVIRSVEGEYFEGSTIASIISLPFPINIILSSLFFLFAPLFSFPVLQNGIFIVITFFNATLTPLYFIAISPFLYHSILKKHKSENLRLLIYLCITFLIVLGTVSLQIRHKNIIFPFLSILAAFGYRFTNVKTHSHLVAFLTVSTVFIEFIYAIYAYI